MTLFSASTFYYTILLLSLGAYSSAFLHPCPPPDLHLPQQRKSILEASSGDSSLPDGDEDRSICIIGGGVSGLAAAYTAAQQQTDDNSSTKKVILLEASSTLGGRVQSDIVDGYILDRGFAVFLEQYPNSKQLLDYNDLDLHQFDPGALVKLEGRDGLSRVADPLRQPRRLLDAITSPVGTVMDKARLVPLLGYVVSTSIEEMFEEEETDTLTCLRERWRFSDSFIDEFLSPFLEGIYLAPLSQQSSRMFHFVFKMFTVGSVSLPRNGIGAVSDQLVEKARSIGVEIRTNRPIDSISVGNDGAFTISQIGNSMHNLRADRIVLATDVRVAQRIISTMDGYANINSDIDPPVERSVGCLYYGFETDAPTDEPILVLNGAGRGIRGTKTSPINNVCFPSVVCDSYAPSGCHLCSVSILQNVMEEFEGKDDELDSAARSQLAEWFPSHAEAILDPSKWVLKGTYRISNAQPAQFGVPYPASVNKGRDAATFRGFKLPDGMFLAGDHMTTSSLNGALGSGIIAGDAACK